MKTDVENPTPANGKFNKKILKSKAVFRTPLSIPNLNYKIEYDLRSLMRKWRELNRLEENDDDNLEAADFIREALEDRLNVYVAFYIGFSKSFKLMGDTLSTIIDKNAYYPKNFTGSIALFDNQVLAYRNATWKGIQHCLQRKVIEKFANLVLEDARTFQLITADTHNLKVFFSLFPETKLFRLNELAKVLLSPESISRLNVFNSLENVFYLLNLFPEHKQSFFEAVFITKTLSKKYLYNSQQLLNIVKFLEEFREEIIISLLKDEQTFKDLIKNPTDLIALVRKISPERQDHFLTLILENTALSERIIASNVDLNKLGRYSSEKALKIMFNAFNNDVQTKKLIKNNAELLATIGFLDRKELKIINDELRTSLIKYNLNFLETLNFLEEYECKEFESYERNKDFIKNKSEFLETLNLSNEQTFKKFIYYLEVKKLIEKNETLLKGESLFDGKGSKQYNYELKVKELIRHNTNFLSLKFLIGNQIREVKDFQSQGEFQNFKVIELAERLNECLEEGQELKDLAQKNDPRRIAAQKNADDMLGEQGYPDGSLAMFLKNKLMVLLLDRQFPWVADAEEYEKTVNVIPSKYRNFFKEVYKEYASEELKKERAPAQEPTALVSLASSSNAKLPLKNKGFGFTLFFAEENDNSHRTTNLSHESDHWQLEINKNFHEFSLLKQTAQISPQKVNIKRSFDQLNSEDVFSSKNTEVFSYERANQSQNKNKDEKIEVEPEKRLKTHSFGEEETENNIGFKF